MTTSWQQVARDELAAIDVAGRRRALRTFDARGPVGTFAGREVVSFAGNDYLGLSAHPTVIAAAVAAEQQWGTGATASRLVVGDRPVHGQLERAYADWKGAEAAVVTSSGFAANLAVLSTFGASDVTILSDEWNHASIVDGCRLARARTAIYRHGDLESFDAVLAATPGRVIVVTDSVFSMDGDVAPLDGLASRCVVRGALLVIDEAHEVFPTGFVPPAELDVVRVGTLSKTLGSMGGIVAGPQSLIDLIINRARPFIFSTGLTPAAAAAAAAAIEIVREAEGAALLARLRQHVDCVRPGHPSPIVPVILGAESAALAAAAELLDLGLLVPAIRPPTVAVGTARLRITLCSAHEDADVARLVDALHAAGWLS